MRKEKKAGKSVAHTGETSSATTGSDLVGGCACGSVRYRLSLPPLFVHCCHCTRCQRESGTAFVTHAVMERAVAEVTGETVSARQPTDSRRRHEIVHCATCLTPLTLDVPTLLPTQAHIFVRSKLPWVSIDGVAPAFKGYYVASKTWPVESLNRLDAAKQA